MSSTVLAMNILISSVHLQPQLACTGSHLPKEEFDDDNDYDNDGDYTNLDNDDDDDGTDFFANEHLKLAAYVMMMMMMMTLSFCLEDSYSVGRHIDVIQGERGI